MLYKIKNWQDYQHYKDRCPPWIKLHQSLITSKVWIKGNDQTRALLIACMLLASRNEANDGTFDGDEEYIKSYAYLNTKPNFKPLIDNGFIECVQDASIPLSACNTEKSREEKEKSRVEGEKIASPNFVLPDWIDKEKWELWLKTRKGKKMIPEQMQAQVDKLDKWKAKGLDYGKALSDAADNGWQGLFEPKEDHRKTKQKMLESANDQAREIARAMLFGGKNETI